MPRKNTTESVFGRDYGGSAPPENYERYFVPAIGGPLAEDLIADAALQPGESILDVACGTGVVARLAAGRIGTTGRVAALDQNPAMLSTARSIACPGAPIGWYESSAESIPLPDGAFDVVFCQLGLQFVADKGAALREIHRVLAPGGRVLASTPSPNPLFDVLENALARHVGSAAAAFVRVVFSLNDPATIERLFREAEFHEVRVRTYTKPLRLPAAREFLWQYVHSTPLAGMLPDLDPARKAALQDDVVHGWQPWSEDGGITYVQGMHVASARR